LKFTPDDGIVTINLTIEHKEICNCNNVDDDLEQQQQQHNQEDCVIIDIIDDLARSNKINSTSMNNDNKCFLKMTIKDNGPGITKENQKKLFKNVVQFNPGLHQNGGGSGLGMFISKNIMDLHKGCIGVYSAGMGHGCTFTIELPIIVNTINIHDSYIYTSSTDLKISENDSSNNNDMNMTESELSPSNGSTIVDSESEHVNAKIKALVVDDSSMNRKMVRRLLEMKGLQHIYEAENGLDGYELVKKHHEDNDDFNFIITDNQMPVMDGITSVTKIREIGYQHKIIMITGDCLVQDQTNMVNCGVNTILLKPIDKDKLFALLNL